MKINNPNTERYFGRWHDHETMVREFSEHDWSAKKYVPPEDMAQDSEILFASYGGGAYEGDAFVLFLKDGKLYEVNGSHCSCYGLEGQWSPEETTIAALAMRERPNGERWYGFLYDHDDEAVAAYWKLVDQLVVDNP